MAKDMHFWQLRICELNFSVTIHIYSGFHRYTFLTQVVSEISKNNNPCDNMRAYRFVQI